MVAIMMFILSLVYDNYFIDFAPTACHGLPSTVNTC